MVQSTAQTSPLEKNEEIKLVKYYQSNLNSNLNISTLI